MRFQKIDSEQFFITKEIQNSWFKTNLYDGELVWWSNYFRDFPFKDTSEIFSSDEGHLIQCINKKLGVLGGGGLGDMRQRHKYLLGCFGTFNSVIIIMLHSSILMEFNLINKQCLLLGAVYFKSLYSKTSN